MVLADSSCREAVHAARRTQLYDFSTHGRDSVPCMCSGGVAYGWDWHEDDGLRVASNLWSWCAFVFVYVLFKTHESSSCSPWTRNIPSRRKHTYCCPPSYYIHMCALICIWVCVFMTLFSAAFQLIYTTIFGMLASFLFLRTGSILPPFSAHVFCNIMGLPDPVYEVQRHPRKKNSTCLLDVVIYIV